MIDDLNYLADVYKRLVEMKKEKEFTVLVEISLTEQQIETFGKAVLCFANPEINIKEYLMNKCHGNALMSKGRYSCKEEQPDFQKLIDFAFYCLDANINMDDFLNDKDKIQHGYK